MHTDPKKRAKRPWLETQPPKQTQHGRSTTADTRRQGPARLASSAPGGGRTRLPPLVWTRVSPSTVMTKLLDALQVLNPNSTKSSTLNSFQYWPRLLVESSMCRHLVDKTWKHARSTQAPEFTAPPHTNSRFTEPSCLLQGKWPDSTAKTHLLDLKRTMLNTDLSLKAKQFRHKNLRIKWHQKRFPDKFLLRYKWLCKTTSLADRCPPR